MAVLKKDPTGLVNRLMYSLLVLQIPPVNLSYSRCLTQSRKKSNEIEAPNIVTVREIMRIIGPTCNEFVLYLKKMERMGCRWSTQKLLILYRRTKQQNKAKNQT